MKLFAYMTLMPCKSFIKFFGVVFELMSLNIKKLIPASHIA